MRLRKQRDVTGASRPGTVTLVATNDGIQVLDDHGNVSPLEGPAQGPAGPHTHDEYAADDHAHAPHNHDAAYSASAHGHVHNHDGTYAPAHAHPYAASVHGHAIGDSSGLQAALDGKAATHSHPYEASGAVSTHAGLADPHPGYLTLAEGNAAYSSVVHGHAAPVLTDQDIPTSIARDAEVTAAISTHAATPHGGSSAPAYATPAGPAVDLATNTVVKVTVSANVTLTTTVPPAGSWRSVLILTSGTQSRTVTFGTGFKPTATLATGTTAGRIFTTSWVSDGTNLYEAGRTVAMVA